MIRTYTAPDGIRTTVVPVKVGYKENLSLEMSVTIGDEVIVDWTPCHSILGQFINALYSMCNYGREEWWGQIYRARGITSATYVDGITAATKASPCVITCDDTVSGYNSPYAYNFWIQDVGGMTELNGRNVWLKIVSGNTYELYSEPSLTTPIDSSSFGTYTSGGLIMQNVIDQFVGDTYSSQFQYPTIWAGHNTDANVIDLKNLHYIINGSGSGELSYGSPTTDWPVVGASSSYIQTQRSMANNSGAQIDVEELGLYAQIYSTSISGYLNALIARDVTNVPIADASTAIVKYRIVTSQNASGGFTQWFNELLARQMKVSARSVTDITNVTRSENRDATQFWSYDYWGLPEGVVCGTGTGAMAMDNYYMDTVIPHGEGDGELFHYGAACWNYDEDTVSDTVSFDVERMFLSMGSNPITVEETGWVVNANGYPSLIARHLLGGSAVTIPAGDAWRLIYRLTVSV